jgi:uncharacterized protein (DUF58 family)
MGKVLFLGLIIYVLIFIGLVTRSSGLLALALPLMVYLAVGLFYEPPSPRLVIERRLSNDRASTDELITVTLKVTNTGQPLKELFIEELVPATLSLVDGPTNRLTALDSGQSTQLSYTVSGRRGLHRFTRIRIRARDQLGLFSKQSLFTVENQLLVLPEIARLKRATIRPRRIGVYPGVIPARQGGPGIEFYGVREYQPGDPLRWLNQRAGARYPETHFVNEFEQERMVDVGLILDARHQSEARCGPESLFEHSIQATATLADAFLNMGNRVGLFIYGRSLNWTLPGYGKIQRERILRSLAMAELGEGKVFEKLEYLPTRLFPAQSQLVFVSPLLSEDPDLLVKLRAQGYHLLVISPDPIAFEQKGLPAKETVAMAAAIARLERELILARLRQAGVQVIDWPVDITFAEIAHTALRRAPPQPRIIRNS